MRFQAGSRVLVRCTDGSEWLGTVRRRSWWRELMAPGTIELAPAIDAETEQQLDGVLVIAARYFVTVQVVA